MKRLFFSLLSLLAFVSTIAQDFAYPYMIFKDATGDQTTVSAASLEITFADGQLVATNGDGTTRLPLTSLSSMFFSETGDVSPIPSVKTESGLALDAELTDQIATLGEDFVEPTITNPNALTLTWTSSDESVVTVDSDGNVTLVGVGTATISALFAGDDTYEAGSVSYTLTVAEPDAVSSLTANEPVNVYTIAGVFVGTFNSPADALAHLQKGLYVVRQNEDSSIKLTVK